MFFHDLKYFIKCGLRSQDLMFWLILFPIALGGFFKVAFGDLYSQITDTSPIPVAVVSEKENQIFSSALESVSGSDDSFLDVTFTDRDTAAGLLKDGKVTGVISSGDKVSLTVAENGLEQTMLKEFVERFRLNEKVISDAASSDPTKIQQAVSALSSEISPVKNVKAINGNSDVFVQYFYNLIAMTALYGTMLGLKICVENQADLSPLGARKCCSPVPKIKGLSAALCGCFILQTLCMVICVTYLVFILKIDLGNRLALVYLASIAGGITGVAMGFFVSSIGSISERMKSGITLGVVMFLCFLSGLMVGNMKGVIAEKAPWFNKINPAAVISDCIYCLNFYSDYRRFITKMLTLAAMTLIFSALGIFMTRRKKYASL